MCQKGWGRCFRSASGVRQAGIRRQLVGRDLRHTLFSEAVCAGNTSLSHRVAIARHIMCQSGSLGAYLRNCLVSDSCGTCVVLEPVIYVNIRPLGKMLLTFVWAAQKLI